MNNFNAKEREREKRKQTDTLAGKVSESKQIMLNIVNFAKICLSHHFEDVRMCAVWELKSWPTFFFIGVVTIILNGDSGGGESDGAAFKTISFHLHKNKFIGDILFEIHSFS